MSAMHVVHSQPHPILCPVYLYMYYMIVTDMTDKQSTEGVYCDSLYIEDLVIGVYCILAGD